jgi:hypothetical protein
MQRAEKESVSTISYEQRVMDATARSYLCVRIAVVVAVVTTMLAR